MGSSVGYEYRYNFSEVDEGEINSLYKSSMKFKPGFKPFLFEIRTDFILEMRRERREEEKEEEDAVIDSEKFDAFLYAEGASSRDMASLYFMTGYRLKEYWMTYDEMYLFIKKALAFANQVAAEHASLYLIPVVVQLQVRTVQQQGERFGAALDRAIRAQNLVPIYLWPQPTAVERKPLAGMLMNFLIHDLERLRVEDVDRSLALMPACYICKRRPNIGAQISSLPCKHAFHSHCIVRWLEETNLCPLCRIPAYPARYCVVVLD